MTQLPKITYQLNTYHLARDQQQMSRLTENTEFLIKEFVKINENISNLKSSIETLNTYHLARDQRQMSRLTENTEFLIKEFVKINENISNLKSSIETLISRQIHFEKNTNENLAVLNKKVDSLIEKFKTLSLN